MCNCIEQINQALKEQGKEDRILLSTSMNISTGAFREVLPIYATKYTRGGNPKNGMAIFANYCPFCGDEYTKESVPAKP